HAALARTSSKRLVELLGIRDAMMADNLAYMVSRERGRGKVLAFAHNSHLKCGKAQWQLGPDLLTWWPAGAHLHEMLGPRYAVIGSAVGVSDDNGIGPPEVGTLEARLTAPPGPARLLPTPKSPALPHSPPPPLPTPTAPPTRPGSMKTPTYFPLPPQIFPDFDWLVLLDSTASPRGGPPLQPLAG